MSCLIPFPQVQSEAGKAKRASDERVVALQPSLQPGEKPAQVYPLLPDKRFGIPRFAIGHRLFVRGVDFSKHVESVDVSEEVGKDDEIRISLDNTRFQFTDSSALASGSIVSLSLFDGIAWRDFKPMVVLESEYEFSERGKVTLVCRTRAIALKRIAKAGKWVDKTDSEVVEDIGTRNGFVVRTKPTTERHKEIVQANEETTLFLNKLANRNGYEWYIDDNTLVFAPISAEVTGIELTYRPTDRRIGTIISARYKKEEDKKRGSKKEATPVVAATDFTTGNVDAETLSEATASELEYGVNSDLTPPSGADPVESDVVQQLDDNVSVAAAATQKQGKAEPKKPDRRWDTANKKWVELPMKDLRSNEVAVSSEQAQRIAKATADLNAYPHVLEIETYGMVDVRIRKIVTLRGLSSRIDGKWYVKAMRTSYSAGSAYRLSLTCVAAQKAEAQAVLAEEKAKIEAQKEKDGRLYVRDQNAPDGWRLAKGEDPKRNKTAPVQSQPDAKPGTRQATPAPRSGVVVRRGGGNQWQGPQP